MQVTKTCAFTGVERTLDLDVTPAEIAAYENGALVQEAMPRLNVDEREFILTGSWDGEWENMCEELEDAASGKVNESTA